MGNWAKANWFFLYMLPNEDDSKDFRKIEVLVVPPGKKKLYLITIIQKNLYSAGIEKGQD